MIVWLASYPRSGNTFLRIILNKAFGYSTLSMYDDVDDISKDKATKEIVGHANLPDDFDFDNARKSDEVYFIKTHDYPENSTDKAIYIVRDGREASLSYLEYKKSFSGATLSLLDIMYGNVLFGCWGAHVDAWNPLNRDNTLFLKFENVIENPDETVKKIALFLDMSKKDGEIPGFKQLSEINSSFFRKGEKSSWKKALTESQHIIFWLKNYKQMLDCGYKDMPEDIANLGDMKLLEFMPNESCFIFNRVREIKYEHEMQLRRQLEYTNTQLTGLRESFTKYNKILGEYSRKHDALEARLNRTLVVRFKNFIKRFL